MTTPLLNSLFLHRFWESPELLSINRVPMRATLYPFSTRAQARSLDREKSPWVQNLNGSWLFKMFERPEEVTASDVCVEVSRSDWKPITVPGNWTLQGYGNPHYTNVQMPFSDEPPFVPARNPTGIYAREFQMPITWKNRRIIIHFGGSESVLCIYVNGNFIGIGKDSRLPSEFDITSTIRFGEKNLVTAIVIKWSDATFIEDQDQWWMGGIHREVYLYATESIHIADVFASATLENNYQDGRLNIAVKVGFPRQPENGWRAEVQLYDGDGKVVLCKPISSPVNAASPGTCNRLQAVFDIVVKKTLAWSAEIPNCYTLVVALKNHLDIPIEYTATRLGFRTVEVRDRKLLINGQRVLIKGVNRHDHHDIKGTAVDRQTMRLDALLMKQFNFNAVRCSHYPNDPYWLDLCDELGLYVIDEANLEGHAYYHQLGHDARYSQAFLDRVVRMVERDKNHACVISWSLGNETGHGPNQDAMAGWVRGYDPKRPLHYEPGICVQWVEKQPFEKLYDGGYGVTDIVCPMYAHPEVLVEWANDRSHPDRTRPLILCEYSHAMGNSNGGLSDYFHLFETVPGLQGGFIWEWIDHGLRRTSEKGSTYWAYGGDYGDTPNDANFVCDGLLSSDRKPHPALFEFKKLAQPVQAMLKTVQKMQIEVANRNNFSTLEWLVGEWELLVDGVRVISGKLPRLKARPGKKQLLNLRLPKKNFRGCEASLLLRFKAAKNLAWCKAGHIVAWEQLPLPTHFLTKPFVIKSTTASLPSIIEGPCPARSATVSTGKLDLVIDSESGGLTRLGCDRQPILDAAPVLNVWRAPTDNDGIKLWSGQEAKPMGHWQALGLNRLASRLIHSRFNQSTTNPAWTFSFAATGRNQWKDVLWSYTMRLSTAGALNFSAEFNLGPDLVDIPRIGLLFQLSPGYQNLRWLGLGPLENYPDRKSAAWRAFHSSTIDAEYVPYVMPQEHGLKCETTKIELTGKAPQLCIESERPVAFSVSRFHPQDLTEAFHTIDLKPRAGAILCLDASHRGIGTASCGPDAFDPYKIRGHRFTLNLEFCFPSSRLHS